MKTTYANIMLLGRTGVGKSELINYIIGEHKCKTGAGFPVTPGFETLICDNVDGIPLRIYDSKGLEAEYYGKIRDEIVKFISDCCEENDISKWIHSIFYCINSEEKVQPNEIEFLKHIKNGISRSFHVVFTHCDNDSENIRKCKAKQQFIEKELNDANIVFCRVCSVNEVLIDGTVISQFGKEELLDQIFKTLWSDISFKVAHEYAIELCRDTKNIADDIADIMDRLVKKVTPIKLIGAFVKEMKGEVSDFIEETEAEFNKRSDRLDEKIDAINCKYHELLITLVEFCNGYGTTLTGSATLCNVFDFNNYMADADFDKIYENSMIGELEKKLDNIDDDNFLDILGGIFMIGGAVLTVKTYLKDLTDSLMKELYNNLPVRENVENDVYNRLMKGFAVPVRKDEAAMAGLSDTAAKNERNKILKEYTDDEEILGSDNVAFSQEDLVHLLENGAKTVYLLGRNRNKFAVSAVIDGVTYIGIDNPKVDLPYRDYYRSEGEDKYVFRYSGVCIKIINAQLSDDFPASFLGDYCSYYDIWSHCGLYENKVVQCEIGFCYENGMGALPITTNISYNETFDNAFFHYMESAEQGYAYAQAAVANCFLRGIGTEKDEEKAFEWYMKSAAQNCAAAQCGIGDCYYNGNGVEKDYEKAFEWYMKSAEQGSSNAQKSVGVCYYHGNGIGKDRNKAFEWFEKSAENGNISGQFNLATCYYYGCGAKQDYEKAFKWYMKAAGEDSEVTIMPRMENMGRDSEKVLELYKAAYRDHIIAPYMAGICFYNGRGTEKNYEKAFKMFQSSAFYGYRRGQYRLALMYYKGEYEEQNYTEAFEWFLKSAEQDYPDAQYMAGVCYYYGRGVTENKNSAHMWLKKAANNNNEEARKFLENDFRS